jgi:hypothetical protein
MSVSWANILKIQVEPKVYCSKCTAEMRFKGAIDVAQEAFSKVSTVPIRV